MLPMYRFFIIAFLSIFQNKILLLKIINNIIFLISHSVNDLLKQAGGEECNSQ